MRITALGELLIDFSLRDNNSDGYPIMDAHPGGAPANFLAAAKKYGTEASFIGKVGNDVFGRLLINTLNSAGIETKGLIVSDKVFTTLAFVTFNEDNDREFSFARKPGADTCLEENEVAFDEIDKSDAFHFGTLSLTDEPSKTATIVAVEYAISKGKIISFDPNLRKPLWNDLKRAKEMMFWGLDKADVVKISDEEVEFLFPGFSIEDASKIIIDNYGASIVFVTMGKNGCFYRSKNCFGHIDGLKDIVVKDTTGAGDIFGGSAMHSILQKGKKLNALTKEELEDIVKFAIASSGLSTTISGGISSVPALEKINEVLHDWN